MLQSDGSNGLVNTGSCTAASLATPTGDCVAERGGTLAARLPWLRLADGAASSIGSKVPTASASAPLAAAVDGVDCTAGASSALTASLGPCSFFSGMLAL